MRFTNQLKVLILSCVALAACSKEPQYVQPPIQQMSQQLPVAAPQPQAQPQIVYQQAQQPVVVQQAAPQGNNDMLIGGMLGYMLGGAGARGGGGGGSTVEHHTTTVNKTVVNKTYVQQAPKPSYSAPRPSSGGRRK